MGDWIVGGAEGAFQPEEVGDWRPAAASDAERVSVDLVVVAVVVVVVGGGEMVVGGGEVAEDGEEEVVGEPEPLP
jgi:hypothetical protein